MEQTIFKWSLEFSFIEIIYFLALYRITGDRQPYFKQIIFKPT